MRRGGCGSVSCIVGAVWIGFVVLDILGYFEAGFRRSGAGCVRISCIAVACSDRKSVDFFEGCGCRSARHLIEIYVGWQGVEYNFRIRRTFDRSRFFFVGWRCRREVDCPSVCRESALWIRWVSLHFVSLCCIYSSMTFCGSLFNISSLSSDICFMFILPWTYMFLPLRWQVPHQKTTSSTTFTRHRSSSRGSSATVNFGVRATLNHNATETCSRIWYVQYRGPCTYRRKVIKPKIKLAECFVWIIDLEFPRVSSYGYGSLQLYRIISDYLSGIARCIWDYAWEMWQWLGGAPWRLWCCTFGLQWFWLKFSPTSEFCCIEVRPLLDFTINA